MTIKEIIASSKLDRLDTRVILSYVTGFSNAQLISRDDYQLNSLEYEIYTKLYTRALDGEPIAYLLGYKEFYGRSFKVTSDTLIPRPETELLVDKVLEFAKLHDSIIDLGTGSGCIAITCKLERPDLNITAVDKFSNTLIVARNNAITLNADINFICSNWFDTITNKFDIIVSNPPYIEVNDEHLLNLQYEPQSALTDFADGFSCIRIIAEKSSIYLKNNGWLMIEHGYNQGYIVRKIFENNGLQEIETFKDYAGLERFTIGKYII